MTERDALTSALAGPLVNARARSAGVAPWAPTPGQQQDRLRHQLARLADRARMGRADDGADRREPVLADEVLAPLRDELRDVLPHRAPVGERHVLDVAAGVRGLDDAEDAGAVAPRGREVRLDRLAPEPRVDGERVGAAARRLRGRRPRRRARSSRCRRACRRRSRAGRRGARRRRPPRTRPSPRRPSASKNASCGLTATACGATASTIPQQKRATSPRSSTGSRSGCGSSPTTSWLRLRSTSAARRSAKVSVATAIRRQLSRPGTDGGPRATRPSSKPVLRACSPSP